MIDHETLLQFGYFPLDKLSLWQGNYNQGDVGVIYTSIKKWGFNKGVSRWFDVVSGDMVVIAGNHTVKALRALQADGKTPKGNALIVHDGHWYIQAADASHLSPDDAIAYAIADNRTAQLATQDDELLLKYLSAIEQDAALNNDPQHLTATGYDADDLQILRRILHGTDEDDEEGGDNGSAGAEGSGKTGARYGDDEIICPNCGTIIRRNGAEDQG